MARSAALVAASLAGIAALIVIVVVLVRFLPAPVAPGAGNPLQPLADDLTWVYTGNATDVIESDIPFVIGITGQEPAGTGTNWLLQSGIGQAFATRLVLVQRGDEVWTTAADALEDGQWKRWTFSTPQLFQPPPGERKWLADFAGGPDGWRFSASWQQRASGDVTVLGRTAPAWLVEGDLLFDGSKGHEVDTFVEGVGLTSIFSVNEGPTSIRWDLSAFRDEPGEIVGRYRNAADTKLTVLVSTSGWTMAMGDDDPRPVSDVHVDGAAVTFTAADGTGKFSWAGRQGSAGLIGTATRPDRTTKVMDFVRLEAGP